MSEDAEVKAGTSGYVDLKIGKSGFKVLYAVVVGGSLFYYKNITVCSCSVLVYNFPSDF
jgi:hypothetical protein